MIRQGTIDTVFAMGRRAKSGRAWLLMGVTLGRFHARPTQPPSALLERVVEMAGTSSLAGVNAEIDQWLDRPNVEARDREEACA